MVIVTEKEKGLLPISNPFLSRGFVHYVLLIIIYTRLLNKMQWFLIKIQGRPEMKSYRDPIYHLYFLVMAIISDLIFVI